MNFLGEKLKIQLFLTHLNKKKYVSNLILTTKKNVVFYIVSGYKINFVALLY